MADIKTELRELSVAYGIYIYFNEINIDVPDPKTFLHLCEQSIDNSIKHAFYIKTIEAFDDVQKSIILNGVRLAKVIVEKLKIVSMPKIVWTGSDTQKNDPIDLYINGSGVSLKEESFILENMGLYKLINLLTDGNFVRGLHIFKKFASTEYNIWFIYARKKLYQYLSTQGSRQKTYRGILLDISLSDSQVVFSYGDQKFIIPQNTTIENFERITNSLVREKIFSKRIKECLERDVGYLKVKKECSVAAGKNLVTYINDNFKILNSNLLRFLQIYTDKYFYAKVTNREMCFFEVPGLADFTNIIQVKNISYSVPRSQLNFFTTIRNKITGQEIVLRNEIRFSHGQFNGTPEAKMYYERGSSLDVIYTPL